MLFIHNDVVERVLSMKECIEVQEAAFKALETGDAIHRPRIDMYAPAERPDGYYRWRTMEGWYDDRHPRLIGESQLVEKTSRFLLT